MRFGAADSSMAAAAPPLVALYLKLSVLRFGANGRMMRRLPMLKLRSRKCSSFSIGPYFPITSSIVIWINNKSAVRSLRC